jgi:hypothetical protein
MKSSWMSLYLKTQFCLVLTGRRKVGLILFLDYSSSANNRHSVWEEEMEATDCSSPPDKLEDDGELDGEVGKRLNDMVATPVSLFLPSLNVFYFLICTYKFLLRMYSAKMYWQWHSYGR